eukprot:8130715-Prorocentrum_lima.AAC.1
MHQEEFSALEHQAVVPRQPPERPPLRESPPAIFGGRLGAGCYHAIVPACLCRLATCTPRLVPGAALLPEPHRRILSSSSGALDAS